MKTIRLTILSLAALLTGISGYSQSEPSGIVMNTYAFTPADMLVYSQSGYSFGTARSSAMGGAFTSLGGDLASIGINPAGIGMYRSSAWGFSPSLTISDTRAKYSNGHDLGHTRFAFNNIGVVLAASNSSRGLVSFNMGFSYNKTADFNFRSGATLPAGDKSLLQIFQLQLNGLHVRDNTDGSWMGITKGALDGDPFNAGDIGLQEWGSVLSYLTGAVSPVNPNDNDNVLYRTGSLGNNIVPSFIYDSRGSIGEYNLSGGFNINNVFYIGLGMAIQDILQYQEIVYMEEYGSDNITGTESLESMTYRQTSEVSGTGLNFKIGVIARPVAGLRIGVAVHTPSTIGLTNKYIADMETRFRGINTYDEAVSYTNIVDYSFTNPTRLLAGISYTLSNIAAISFDYERVFFNGMRLNSGDFNTNRDYRDRIKETYRATDNFRAGIEVKPLPGFAIRGGYSYSGSPFKFDDFVTTRYTPIETQNISAGLGFWLNGNTTFDVAYIYSQTKYADMELFSYRGEGFLPDAGGAGYYTDVDIAPSDLLRGLRQNRHTITMSFNFLF